MSGTVPYKTLEGKLGNSQRFFNENRDQDSVEPQPQVIYYGTYPYIFTYLL
jgi:hypothetical protein